MDEIRLDRRSFRIAFDFYEATLKDLSAMNRKAPAALGEFWKKENDRIIEAGQNAPELARMLLVTLHEYFESEAKQ